ncbi:transcriptional regulator WhiB-like [Mycobacterium phage Krypton555]|uniref:WhiB family transcription factor n=1 Tax=Mycobacterium phage Krypton555 TaxID=2015885 RepID=A0A222ZQY7_9CAUD|nr:transcriptional regulator WhiB-like [Mycobacterium phage Krypton555]ASR87107.1 WhiB family transcription factor [Mycobacterium phage Krypton555]
MSKEIEALMSPKPLHWTEEALCHDDRRFTGRYEDMGPQDWTEMAAKCFDCPVIKQCADWAYREQVTDVFAAGYWRNLNEQGKSAGDGGD